MRTVTARPKYIGKRHPNLAAKAKELLDKVNEELKMAAEAANKNHK